MNIIFATDDGKTVVIPVTETELWGVQKSRMTWEDALQALAEEEVDA